MTTYNGSSFVIEQLDSIKNQTVPPDEVLIFDDCSTDNTVQIVDNYIKNNRLLGWIVKKNSKNKGYALNFSDAMKAASGDIIFLSDQDDIWFSDKIENMLRIMNKHPEIDLLASNVVPFYMGKDPKPVNFEKFGGTKELVQIRNRSKWIKPSRPGCSMCFRQKLLERYDELWFDKYAHDCLLWGMAVLSGTAYLYNKDTIHFRRHDTNASSRVAHKNENRVMSLKREIQISKKMLSFANEGNFNENIQKLLKKQNDLYQKRLLAIEDRNLLGIVRLLPSLKYYSRNRYWFTDIFYCIKK